MIYKAMTANIDGCSKEHILVIVCNRMHHGFLEFTQKLLRILGSGKEIIIQNRVKLISFKFYLFMECIRFNIWLEW